MRRIVSISVMLLLWLGPLAALLPGSDESRLPFCCRRHGAHHCAMPDEQTQGSTPSWAAPSRCPQFPASAPAIIAPHFAITDPSAREAGELTGRLSPPTTRESDCSGRPRTQEDRGPPRTATA
ncbi:MAG TPA: hypothetical protein VGG85_06735 [Terracidiphilus sp.]